MEAPSTANVTSQKASTCNMTSFLRDVWPIKGLKTEESKCFTELIFVFVLVFVFICQPAAVGQIR